MSQYPWTLLAVYVVTTGSVQLLALWAAYSPRPWLLRALVVWTPIALLATIRAYEPAILLLMSAALTIGICLAVERFKSPRMEDDRPPTPLWRFRLSDLLVLVLFLATWLALTRPGAVWIGSIYSLYFAAFALPFAVLTVFVHRAVIGPWRWTMAALALGTIWFCALVLRYHDVPQYLGEGALTGREARPFGRRYKVRCRWRCFCA